LVRDLNGETGFPGCRPGGQVDVHRDVGIGIGRCVRSASTDELVVAQSANQNVVSTTAIDDIVTGTAIDCSVDIAARAGKDVVAL